MRTSPTNGAAADIARCYTVGRRERYSEVRQQADVRRRGCQLGCRPCHLTVVQNYEVDPMANQRCLALAGCCIPTGYGAVKNVGKVTPGSTCAVWGLGAVGMCVLLACKDQGASKIIGIDLNPRKFLRAIQFGATDCLDPEEVNVKDRLSEMTNGGVDFCFVSVGVVSAMEQAFLSSHPQWGKTVVIGLANVGETMKVGVWELIFGRQLLGTYYGSYKSRLHIPHLVDKAQIHLENLVSHYIPLERIADGFDMLKTGESLRTVIDFETRA
ncbi:alcohol dehydrogenase class-3 chain H [Nephila pilipes]|uniref:Alcohol dehydrogenase class-3 chain H n=1 Tax=Nephila pilipes TaxID=299642 RepID=A0A8X6QRB5_NEPPI|nr:alcohol dehydrogenase class-3 chain H [Nephila pilipes]